MLLNSLPKQEYFVDFTKKRVIKAETLVEILCYIEKKNKVKFRISSIAIN